MNTRPDRRGATGIGALRRRTLAAFAIIGVLVSGTVAGSALSPAYATDWPTWADVAAVRNDQAATAAKVAEIKSLLAALQAEADRTAADAEAKGAIWRELDQNYQEAALRESVLRSQAEAAQAVADESKRNAGQMYALIARTGNRDLTATLLVSSGTEGDLLLDHLGLANKLSQQAQSIFDKAIQDSNTAQAQTDLADEQAKILEELKLVAEKAFNEARVAAEAAAAALEAQQVHKAELEAQLVVLAEQRAATEADYLSGVRERIGSGASLDAGEISLSGWARPASGEITDSFGMRLHPVYGTWRLHTGTDIGAYCGQNIYAAHGGTVVYAGRNGTYGNWVEIDHGDGIHTGYAHIVDGGILVSYGQVVDVGTNIAKVGTTGASTGCHLHYEVRIDGRAVDSVPFMRDQGITIG
jgi:murein DD-endopeptidase MepM/ murein hydrolase activator NlpD